MVDPISRWPTRVEESLERWSWNIKACSCLGPFDNSVPKRNRCRLPWGLRNLFAGGGAPDFTARSKKLSEQNSRFQAQFPENLPAKKLLSRTGNHKSLVLSPRFASRLGGPTKDGKKKTSFLRSGEWFHIAVPISFIKECTASFNRGSDFLGGGGDIQAPED